MAQSPLQRRGYGYNSVFFTCPGGEIGRRRGLKIPRRKVCRFESDPGHQILKTAAFLAAVFYCLSQPPTVPTMGNIRKQGRSVFIIGGRLLDMPSENGRLVKGFD